MITAEDISYTSEIDREYISGLCKQETLAGLTQFLEEHRLVFPDAYAARPLDDAAFSVFYQGLLAERRKEFAGESWNATYGAILLPEVLMYVGLLAIKFYVPWGCAFQRYLELGGLAKHEDGSVHVLKKGAAL